MLPTTYPSVSYTPYIYKQLDMEVMKRAFFLLKIGLGKFVTKIKVPHNFPYLIVEQLNKNEVRLVTYSSYNMGW